jgi:hypothetical protein
VPECFFAEPLVATDRKEQIARASLGFREKAGELR